MPGCEANRTAMQVFLENFATRELVALSTGFGVQDRVERFGSIGFIITGSFGNIGSKGL